MLAFQERQDGAGQVDRPGGGSDLIVDHRQLILFLGQAQHGLDKILAVQAIEPLGTNDQVIGVEGGIQFSGQFGFSVDIQRPWGIIFQIGTALAAVEDVIGADVPPGGPRFHDWPWPDGRHLHR